MKKFILLFIPLSCLSADISGKYKNIFNEAMKYNRATTYDLKISTPVDLPLTLPLAEEFLYNPLDTSGRILDEIENLKKAKPDETVKSCLGILRQNYDVDLTSENISFTGKIEFDVKLPGELVEAVSDIIPVFMQSGTLLRKSIESISTQQRENIKKILFEETDPNYQEEPDYQLLKKDNQEISFSHWKAEVYKLMEHFDTSGIYHSAVMLSSACETLILELEKLKENGLEIEKKIKSKDGKIIISGGADDEYSISDIENADIIIDLGGNNSYFGNVCSASENQIKVLIDFGKNIRIETSSPAAGSGIFGIGLMYLPNPQGRKTIKTGSYSLGCGICGVGAAFISGPAELLSDVFSQGCAAFGLGVLKHNRASGSIYKADYFSQGAGSTMGLGLFSLTGSSVSISGGFAVQDSREPLGFTSMCQGVGFGPRALAGGGIGIAVLETDNSEIKSSYFAQGSGYWHALGVFHVTGNVNKFQTRRYSQGAGVHSASGMMFLSGEKNQTVNWGVGPAYGWDLSHGIFISSGNDNIFQADWGSACGANGGRGLFYASGDNLKVALPRIGSGSYSRDIAGYGAAVLEGKNITLKMEDERYFSGEKISKIDPWGVLIANNIRLEKIDLPEIVWPKPDGERKRSATQREIPDNLFWVFDILVRRQDVENLLTVPVENTNLLLKLYQPYRVEELLVLRILLSTYGKQILPQLLEEIKNSSPRRKSALLGLLGFQPVEYSVPVMLEALKDNDFRVRASAVKTLAYLFNEDQSPEAGRYTVIKELAKILQENKKLTSETKEELRKLFSNNKYLPDLFALLGLQGKLTAEEKVKLYKLSPSIYELVNENLKESAGEFIFSNRELYLSVFQDELDRLKKLKPAVEEAIILIINDADDRVRVQALTALGEMRCEKSVDLLKNFISGTEAPLKEAAAFSLSKFGSKISKYFENAFESGNEEIKALILTSASHCRDRSLLKLLKKGLKKKSTLVRATAVSSVLNLGQSLSKEKKKLLKRVKG
ncbi:MAG: hypothetical protein AB1633_02770 [Elusimicrobiota bacterium]